MSCKAVILDYIGTLVNCGNYSMEASREKLYSALKAEGFEVAKDRFLAAYIAAHEKYRRHSSAAERRKTASSPNGKTMQSRLNLQLYLCARYLQEPEKNRNKPVLQRSCGLRGNWLEKTKQPNIPNLPEQAEGAG